MRLSEAPPGRYRVWIERLPQPAQLRLLALGMTDGVTVEVLLRRRSSVVVRLRAGRFALGRALAEGIAAEALS